MRGGLIQRGKGRWTASIFLGYSEPDAVTGKRRILQKWISLGKCTRAEAKIKRDELQVAVHKQEFVAPNRTRTVGEWLAVWLDESVRPARRAQHHRRLRTGHHQAPHTSGEHPCCAMADPPGDIHTANLLTSDYIAGQHR
jgi:hypothetical protein